MRHLTVIVTVALGALLGCSRQPLIGVVLPESGEAAVYGSAVKSGISLALADAVAGGRLEVRYEDSQSDPVRAASLAETLFEQGAAVIVGGVTSAEAKAMLPVVDARERVVISPSASAPELSGRSPYFFRVYPSDALEGARAADHLTVTEGVRRVLVLDEDNDYSRGLLNVFVAALRTHGGRVEASVRIGASGWSERLVAALRESRPEAIYICGYGDAILDALAVVRWEAFTGVVCTAAAACSPALLERGGGLADGVVFPLTWHASSPGSGPGADFISAYRASYGLTPDAWAAHGHDAALTAVLALAAAGHHPHALPDALRRLDGVAGVTGPLAFDERGDARRALSMHRVSGGQVVAFTRTADPAEAP